MWVLRDWLIGPNVEHINRTGGVVAGALPLLYDMAEGIVTGVATPIHAGRSTATVQIVITDERGRRTCTARLTCLLLR